MTRDRHRIRLPQQTEQTHTRAPRRNHKTMRPLATIADHRALAQRRLPRFLFEYIDGGSFSEATLRANVADFGRIALRQRVMRDVSEVSTAITLFGRTQSLPIVLGPVGLAGMYARRGEVQAARAAHSAGLPMCLSSVSICDIDEVRAAAGQAPWFQLYMIKDREYMKVLLGRAASLGCPVLVFTVDIPVPAPRWRDVDSGFVRPPSLARQLMLGSQVLRRPRWLWDVMWNGRPHAFGNFAPGIPDARALDNFGAWVARNYEAKLGWDTLAWVREHWRGPIVVKGVLDAEDARAAVAAGADGIVVSNHGGRQLDGGRSSIAALPAVVDAVAQRVPVLFDGGIRSGIDVLKAMALGASACLIGRAWAWGLAGGGERGVAQVIETLGRELRTTMALAGCTDIRQADRTLLCTNDFSAP